MTLIAFFGGIETGLIYALVALGVLISFRILDFPDLTADGSFPLGAVVFAVSVGAGVNPWLACLLGALAGAAAGTVTAWLHVSLNILPLLASILVMVALYSLNLRITGGTPNLPLIDTPSVFSPFTAPDFSTNSGYSRSLSCFSSSPQNSCSTGSSTPKPAWPYAPPALTPAWRAPRAYPPLK